MRQVCGIAVLATALTGCVSSAKYNEVVHSYEELDRVNQDLAVTIEDIQTENQHMRILMDQAQISEQQAQEMLALERRTREETDAIFRGIPGTHLTPGGGLRIENEVLFDSGRADLKDSGKRVLKEVAARLKQTNDMIRIDGHTDAVPINRSRERFATNWHLSAARAAAVLAFLESEGVPANRMFLAGYAEHRPADAGRTPDPRRPNAKDRRVEIYLIQQGR